MRPPRSAYLHIPFCHRRCHYCDFAVVPLGDRAGAEAGAPGSTAIATYLEQLRQEIERTVGGPPLSTVYLGGGTPSMLTPAQVGELLQTLRHRFGIAPGAEVTLELDPASFDQDRLQGYLSRGVNRISLGGQSFDDAVLERLGRRHRVRDLQEAIRWLQTEHQRGALTSWSLDLIQGLPGDDLEHWREQLNLAIAARPPHLSIYDLIVEPGTVFERRQQQGLLELPEADLAADLMDLTALRLAGAGYGHYEISNHALPGHASRHNRVYWSGAGWWGFGMGATTAPWGERSAHPRTRESYAEAIRRPSIASSGDAGPPPGDGAGSKAGLPLDELLLVGLRRREGVALGSLARERGMAASCLETLARRLEPFRQRGLLLIEGDRWRLQAPAGLALSNAVLREMLAWWEEQTAP
ncbi:MAG: radical SAM family heme chaperone HemW [Cyanobacteriota bacterium]